jgi:hypothetical protein
MSMQYIVARCEPTMETLGAHKYVMGTNDPATDVNVEEEHLKPVIEVFARFLQGLLITCSWKLWDAMASWKLWDALHSPGKGWAWKTYK